MFRAISTFTGDNKVKIHKLKREEVSTPVTCHINTREIKVPVLKTYISIFNSIHIQRMTIFVSKLILILRTDVYIFIYLSDFSISNRKQRFHSSLALTFQACTIYCEIIRYSYVELM